MFYRTMLAAALLAVPAILVAEQPTLVTTAHAQQADTSKGKAPATTTKKGKKKAKSAKKTAVKPAAKDTSKAK
jgi:hypothetical protein